MMDPNIWPSLRADAGYRRSTPAPADVDQEIVIAAIDLVAPDDRGPDDWYADLPPLSDAVWQALRPTSAEHLIAGGLHAARQGVNDRATNRSTILARARKGGPMILPNVERVAAAVHESWLTRKRAEGVTSRPHPRTGDEQIAPWADVSEVVKEENRALVRTVYAALETVDAVAEAFPEPPDMKRSFPDRRAPVTPVWIAHACPNCRQDLLIDRISLTVIRASDQPST